MAKRKKKNEFPGIKKILEEMAPVMKEIQNNQALEQRDPKTIEEKDYKLWIINIIKSIEENDEKDFESYNLLIKKYPQTKDITDEMIEQYKIFSVYDFESNKHNFDLPAYLRKISKLIE